jgi:hypothetical protein
MEDLVRDTAELVLHRLGAKIRSISQGKDLGVPGAEALPNVELALRYEGQIQNADSAIEDVIQSRLPALERVFDRAFARVRDAGVDLKAEDRDIQDAQRLFTALVSSDVRLMRTGRASKAWEISRRVVSVAGGNGDIGVTASAQVVSSGIGLGRRSLRAIREQYEIIPGQYVWLHQTSGSNSHPDHLELDGERFDGRWILRDGINWYPGDHDGCRCIALPDFREVG